MTSASAKPSCGSSGRATPAVTSRTSSHDLACGQHSTNAVEASAPPSSRVERSRSATPCSRSHPFRLASVPSPDAPDAPASLAAIGTKIDRRIAALLDAEVERWSAVDGQLREPLAYLREVVGAGGKRLRPAFCYWAFVGAGGDPDSEQVIDAGAALELLHTMAIVHDDVMDGSATRRGMDAVHTAFTSRHAADQLAGEGRRFGEGVAILVGDVAF